MILAELAELRCGRCAKRKVLLEDGPIHTDTIHMHSSRYCWEKRGERC